MQQLDPTHSIRLDQNRGEIHFSASGYWTADRMLEFLAEIDETAEPLLQEKRPIRALGDLRNYVPQNRDTSQIIKDHLLEAKQDGLERLAIIGASALARMQYRRLSKGVDVEFFDEFNAAIMWLRRPV